MSASEEKKKKNRDEIIKMILIAQSLVPYPLRVNVSTLYTLLYRVRAIHLFFRKAAHRNSLNPSLRLRGALPLTLLILRGWDIRVILSSFHPYNLCVYHLNSLRPYFL